jgi:carbon storage regulator
MLVLTRKEGERILIGDDVAVTIVSINKNKVRIGVTAPSTVAVRRAELLAKDEPVHAIEFDLPIDALGDESPLAEIAVEMGV